MKRWSSAKGHLDHRVERILDISRDFSDAPGILGSELPFVQPQSPQADSARPHPFFVTRGSGFQLPDGSVVSPDTSLVRLDRLEALSWQARRRFASLCPDLVVELAIRR